jgi:hypothetical protein
MEKAMTLDNYLKWFQMHERLLLTLAVLGIGVWGYNHWLDSSASKANLQLQVATQQAQVADKNRVQSDAAQAAILTQVQQQTALLQTQVATDKQTIASLVASIASRDAASSNKITSVSGTKTPPQAVADLTSAYPQLPQPIVPTDTGAQVSTEDLQQFTVAKIEGDTAKADLKDTQTELSAAQAEVTADEGIIVQKDKVIAQDAITLQAHDTQAAADAKKAAAELAQVKADARKSKWHTFWWGFAAGFGVRSAIPAK